MKSLINYALYKESLKRFWSIGALFTVWYALFVILPLNSSISDLNYMRAAEQIISIITMRHPAVQIGVVVIPFASVLSLFSYLFQPKSTTAMHALPINKKQIFCTNAAVGLTLIIIPLAILCAFLLRPVVWTPPEMRISADGIEYLGYITSAPAELFPHGIAEGTVINTLPIIAGFFLRALLSSVFYYVLFLPAVIVSGNAVVSVLLCGVVMIITCAFLFLGYLICWFYVFGFETYNFSQYIMKVFTYTNPVALGAVYNLYMPHPDMAPPQPSSLWTYYVAYVSIAAAIFGISYFCSRERKQERAGDSIVFVPLRNVLIFLVATAGMVFVGSFFLSMLGNVVMLYAGFALGFTIAYFIAQMIAEKTFNVLYKAKDLFKYGIIMVAVLGMIILTANLDPTGYQTYIPDMEEVYGVYLHQPYTIYNSIGREPDAENMKSFFADDESVIRDTLAVHEEIVENRHPLRKDFLDYQSNGSSSRIENPVREQYIMYLLKDGRYITRKYALPQDFRESSGLNHLMMDETVILSQYNYFKEPESIFRITFEYTPAAKNRDKNISADVIYNVTPIYIENYNEIVSALEEIKKDIIITERERLQREALSDEAQKSLEINADEDRIFGYVEARNKNGETRSNYFHLENCDNVGNWLESRGLTPKQ